MSERGKGNRGEKGRGGKAGGGGGNPGLDSRQSDERGSAAAAGKAGAAAVSVAEVGLMKSPAHDCAICHEGLRNPRTLPCFHSFCLACLDRAVKSAPPTCPLCRAAFEIPKKDGLSALPVDPFVLNVNKQKETLASVNPNDVKCGCGDEDCVIYCDQCAAFIGESCLKFHRTSKATSSHITMTVDDYFKSSGPASRRMFCQTHETLEVDTFCKQCQLAMCLSCAVPDHVSHQGLVKLTEVASDFSGELKQAASTV